MKSCWTHTLLGSLQRRLLTSSVKSMEMPISWNSCKISPAMRGFLLLCKHFAQWTNICSRPFMAMKAEFCQHSYGKNLVNGQTFSIPFSFLKPWQHLCQELIGAHPRGRPLLIESWPICQPSLYGKFQMNGTLFSVNIFSWKSRIRLHLNERALKTLTTDTKNFFCRRHLFLYTQHSILCYNINIKRGRFISANLTML